MTTLTDLGRKLDRASYDLAKSLVKLDEMQQHGEQARETAILATLVRLRAVYLALSEVEALDVLADRRVPAHSEDIGT